MDSNESESTCVFSKVEKKLCDQIWRFLYALLKVYHTTLRSVRAYISTLTSSTEKERCVPLCGI